MKEFNLLTENVGLNESLLPGLWNESDHGSTVLGTILCHRRMICRDVLGQKGWSGSSNVVF